MGTLHQLPTLGADPKADDRGSEVAFGFVLLVLWVCSAVRVSAAARAHEVFGAEASLAFVCMVAIPWVALRARPRARPPHRVALRPPPRPRSLRNRHLSVVVAPRRHG